MGHLGKEGAIGASRKGDDGAGQRTERFLEGTRFGAETG